MELAFGRLDSAESLEPFYDISSADMYAESDSYGPPMSEEIIEVRPKEIKFGVVPTLVSLSLQAIADHFDYLYDKVPKIPESCWDLFTQILPVTVDMGYAALVIRDGSFWKKCTIQRWPGYHQIEYAGNSWKRYTLERYFAEYIENTEADSIDYLEAKRLAEAFSPFINRLEIKQMNVPRWPEVVDVSDSTNTADSNESNKSGMSKMTLYTFMNRHVKYGEHPMSTDRIYLGTIFRGLHRLEELKICFGYKNYYRYDIMSFAHILKLDALRLASSIEAIYRLRKLCITCSRIPKDMFELIRDSIECHEYLEELELSRMELGDQCMVDIIHILVNVPALRILSLKENGITSLGASVLAYALMHKKIRLKVLDLSYNILDDVAGSILASLVLHQGYLTKLYLRGCGLGSESGINFGLAIKYNTALSVLDLSVNNFDCEAGESLLRGLEANETLSFLDVRGCDLPKETVGDIHDICFEHTELQRKKEPVYKYILPERKKPVEVIIYPELEGEYYENEEESIRMSKYVEEIKKEESVVKSEKSSSGFSEISDMYLHQKEALKLAGFTGTFSSGFGAFIERFVESTRRKQKARKEERPPSVEFIPETVFKKLATPVEYYDKYGMPTSPPSSEGISEASEYSEANDSLKDDKSLFERRTNYSGRKESDAEDIEQAKRYFQIGKRRQKRISAVMRDEEEPSSLMSQRGTVETEKKMYDIGEKFFLLPDKPELFIKKDAFKRKPTPVSDKSIEDSVFIKTESQEKLIAMLKASLKTKSPKQGKKRRNIRLLKKWEALLKPQIDETSVKGEYSSSSSEPRGSGQIPYDVYKSNVGKLSEERELTDDTDVPYWRPQSRQSIAKLTRKLTSVDKIPKDESPSVEVSVEEVRSTKIVPDKSWKEIFNNVMTSKIVNEEYPNDDVFTFKHYLDIPKKSKSGPLRDPSHRRLPIGERLKSRQLRRTELDFIKKEDNADVDKKESYMYGYTSDLPHSLYQSESKVIRDDEEQTSELGSMSLE